MGNCLEMRTKECLEEMEKMPLGKPANVIVLIGRTGVGKSALLEYLTDTQGHSADSSRPVTLEFQLEHIDLHDKRYYIMDTPGFDTDEEQLVFHEIIRGINAVHPHGKIVGVMLVTRINDNRDEAIDNRLVTFINRLCGREYAAQITAVTNFWNVSEECEKENFEKTLNKRLQRWQGLLGQELKQYQHGRQYNSAGEDTGESLKWSKDSNEIKSYAKEMIHRHYGGTDLSDPRIVRELSRGLPIQATTAGAFLRIAPTAQSSSSTSTSSPNQPEATTSPPRNAEPEAEDIPGPAATTGRTNQNQEPQGPHLVERLLNWALDNILNPRAMEGLHRGAPPVGGMGGLGGGFPRHLDPLAPVDHFAARGMPTNLAFRTQWAQARGINLEPGTAGFGDAVRRAIIREHPL